MPAPAERDAVPGAPGAARPPARYWILLAAILALVAWARAGLLDVPLERDEGEYAYGGQLILHGLPPYVHLYNMKPPGIYAAYAGLLALFGETVAGIRTGALVIALVTTALVAALGRRFAGPVGGIAAAATYAVLALGHRVHGPWANAEHVVLVLALAGLVVLVRALDARRRGPLVAAGLLLGLAVTVKQQGAFFAVAALAYAAAWRDGTWRDTARRLGLVGAGIALVLAATLAALARAGALDAFWSWTVRYGSVYVSQVTLADAPGVFRTRGVPIFTAAPLVWALAAGGLASLATAAGPPGRRRFALVLALASAAAVCPGFYFRPHYFLLLLPAGALLAGLTVAWAAARARGRALGLLVPVVLLVVPVADTLVRERAFLVELGPDAIARRVFGPNPFPESPTVARYVAERTPPDAPIVVLGSEPQIYFYARRRAGTGYIYTYALMEEHALALAMQREMIREIEASAPLYLVYVTAPTSWLVRPSSPDLIFRWFADYHRTHYTLEGVVDIPVAGTARYHWGEHAARVRGRSPRQIWILRRRDAGG